MAKTKQADHSASRFKVLAALMALVLAIGVAWPAGFVFAGSEGEGSDLPEGVSEETLDGIDDTQQDADADGVTDADGQEDATEAPEGPETVAEMGDEEEADVPEKAADSDFQEGIVYYVNGDGEYVPSTQTQGENGYATVPFDPDGTVQLMAVAKDPMLNADGTIMDGYGGSGFWYNMTTGQPDQVQNEALPTTWTYDESASLWFANASVNISTLPSVVFPIHFAYRDAEDKAEDFSQTQWYKGASSYARIYINLSSDMEPNQPYVWDADAKEFVKAQTVLSGEGVTIYYRSTAPAKLNVNDGDSSIQYAGGPVYYVGDSSGAGNNNVFTYTYTPSEAGTYSIAPEGTSANTLTLTVNKGQSVLTINNIVIGTMGPYSTDADTATMMVNSSNNNYFNTPIDGQPASIDPGPTTNSPTSPYIVFVGDTLDLSVNNGSATFAVTTGSDLLAEDDSATGATESSIVYTAMAPGNAMITASVGGTVVQKLYVQVQNPIEVQTQTGFVNKDVVHEYVRTANWQAYTVLYSDFLYDPNGNPLYLKNDSWRYMVPYWIASGDTVTLRACSPAGSSDMFSTSSSFLEPVGDPIIEEEGDFRYVTMTYKANATDEQLQGTDYPGNFAITFGSSNPQTFWGTIMPSTTGSYHFDIEVYDGATWTTDVTTVRLGSAPQQTTEDYLAEITEVHGSKVYDESSKELVDLAWWEYWYRFNPPGGDDANDAQHEFTSAYLMYDMEDGDPSGVTDNGQAVSLDTYPATRWVAPSPEASAQEAFDFNQSVLAGGMPIAIESIYMSNPNVELPGGIHWAPFSEIAQVDFDVDVRLTDSEGNALSPEGYLGGPGSILQGDDESASDEGTGDGDVSTQDFNTDENLVPTLTDYTVSMTGQSLTDARNKCPSKLGLDFVADLDGQLVRVILAGTKSIEGRDWDDDVDDGAYSFTIASESENAPLPMSTTVSNDGQTIEFPAIGFTAPGTYKYTITEDTLGANAPDGVSIDGHAFEVEITIPETMDNATISIDGDDEATSFDFVNAYEMPEPDSLTVTKAVRGDNLDPDAKFDFTIELLNQKVTGTYGEVEFTDGVANFQLGDGDSVTATNLPSGTQYKVTETVPEGYTATASKDEGSVTDTEGAVVRFTNTKDAEPAQAKPADKGGMATTGDAMAWVAFAVVVLMAAVVATVMIRNRRAASKQ